MLFPHTRTKSTHGMLTCLKNWFCFKGNEIVPQSFPNCDCHRLNIPCFQRWNISGSFNTSKWKGRWRTKNWHDEFQRKNELIDCNEKFKLKTDPQVSGNKHCRWITKHDKRTKFDENWFGFEMWNPIINENTVTNTRRKNEQDLCLILFCENKHGNIDFGCVARLSNDQSTTTTNRSVKSFELFDHNWRVWLLFRRKPSGELAVWMNVGWHCNCWNVHARSNVQQRRRLIKGWKMTLSIVAEQDEQQTIEWSTSIKWWLSSTNLSWKTTCRSGQIKDPVCV